MRFLTFTTLYPNSVQKHHGLFVEHRLLNFLKSNAGYSTQVMAPVPWFPFTSQVFGRYAEFASVRHQERRGELLIQHPRYLTIPKIGMSVSPFLLALCCRPAIRRLISAGWDFQLIDAHYVYPDGVAAAILGKWFRKPVVITARGTDVNVISDFRLPRALIKWAARNCDKVITVSGALKQKMIDFGVDGGQIETLPNGVDLQMFKPHGREHARRQLGLPLDCNVFVSVGHLIELKGHHLVIEALSFLDKKSVLLIVGEGKMATSLKQLADTIGIADRVKFCGAVSQAELSRYYSAADVSVLASSREGMPNVLLESLACGTPVVSTSVGGAPEVVRSDVAGILVGKREPAEIASAISAAVAGRQSPDIVRSYAERFSWAPISRTQANLFEAVVAAYPES